MQRFCVATGGKTAFFFNRVGLAGCDMGACAILPRIIGQGRAAELLYFGRPMSAKEGEKWGYFNRVVPADDLMATAQDLARRIAEGPNFANMMTNAKKQECTMRLGPLLFSCYSTENSNLRIHPSSSIS